ncbi:hypothetical protein B0H21DRAFT_839541 [Amylocystis lapponica]|nr:hypothetical protein B0H21DRAFT_839541 [Amylocystis lapponica]
MSARRQASTTSLAKYARANSPDLTNRSLDFCNAFWGLGDGGVDVLFARMRGASRTMDELRNFWKERAMIEEQYAKRLASLAKSPLGKDEIGELRLSLDTLRQETDKQAGFHLLVAQQIKTDLEGQATAFLNKQLHHKKTIQAAIEKEFRTKQTQESYVTKAREKYEADCVRINSYTAQSTLMQGKDLDRIRDKLDRAQQTVRANERDFSNFARALQDTVAKWEVDWKAFCDSCQDLEEERMEFMKDNMWAFANAVSTVCVADDESCEKLRLSLEQLEPDKDMENFVRDYGTGSAIPDPPAFVNYASPDAVPSSSQRPSTRPANFPRHTQRVRPMAASPTPQPEEEPEPTMNIAGVGMGGGRRIDPSTDPQLNRAQSRSRASSRAQPEQQQPVPAPNGSVPRMQQPSAYGTRAADPQADPIDPTAKTMLKVGDNAYEVDLARDPQARSGGPSPMQNGPTVSPHNVGREGDPLAKHMEELRNQASAGGGSIRRSGQWKTPVQQAQTSSQGPSPSPTKRDPSAKLSPPPGGSTNNGRRQSVNYRNSAEIVVGAYPIQHSNSRPPSPNPPTANFMNRPRVLRVHPRTCPYRRCSRSTAVIPWRAQPAKQPCRQHLWCFHAEPASRAPTECHGPCGNGAQGRSPSPQPFMPPSRSTSPAMQHQQTSAQGTRRNSFRVPPPAVNGAGRGQQQTHPGSVPGRQGSVSSSITVPQVSEQQQRPTSPNSVGIALDPNGRVAMDSMADMYQQNYRPQQPPASQQPQQQPSRRLSYNNMGANGHPQALMAAPGAVPGGYGAPPAQGPPQPMYPPYGAPPTQQPPQPMYSAPPPVQYQQPPPHQPHQPQVYQPKPQEYGGAVVQDLHRGASMNGYYPQNGGMVHPPPPQPQQHPQQTGYRAPSPMRAPSPQPPVNAPPTNQYTDDGRGVLFYVKALYDYQATIDEEFDFTAGDVIAVTATPEDGWWSGELLDEARRQPGRHVFPSNFVCLF